MSWMELLRMSASNLRRRKLRTFLTVLGVVIGTASIVVMVSLGLGMQKSMYEELEEYGGMKNIKVYGAGMDNYMMSYGGEMQEESEEYVDDKCIETLKNLQHVESAQPVYSMSVMMLKGSYEGYVELLAMTQEGLKNRRIELSEGSLPKTGGQLEFVYGNQLLSSFYEKGSGKGYWDTGELPDIDLSKESMFLILDTEGYHENQGASPFGEDRSGSDMEEGQKPAQIQKHVVRASGLVAGSMDDYNANSFYAFCDLDTLKQVLKKEFAGRAIPGQPQTKNGKPVKQFCYSYAELTVDDPDHVVAVSNHIREMGYTVETNAELLDSMKRQMAIIQAVLGGIGAVSLLVAAIGIANTMMMSIYERTKEIGVMKVLGCSLKNIRKMFLMEAGFIGVIGGVIGNILSFFISVGINAVAAQAMQMGSGTSISYIPFWLMLASIGFAMLVGILAGYFPAKRAMKLSPLEAIRNN